MLSLWIDDERIPGNEWDVWVKTAVEAIALIKAGNVSVISFDHDLGESTGYDVARYIEENASDIKPIKWMIHSANPVGKKNIRMAMESADRRWSKFPCFVWRKNPYKSYWTTNNCWGTKHLAKVFNNEEEVREINDWRIGAVFPIKFEVVTPVE